MTITAAMVKELRQATDAPMMDCKKALVESNGDSSKAKEWLQEKGISRAAKKADRVAAEGSVGIKISDTFTSASLVEINSETDFVAKNDGFKALVSSSTQQIFSNSFTSVEQLMESSYEGKKFSEYFRESVIKIGEKIEVRRLITLNAAKNGCVNGYIHANGRVATLVAAVCDSAKSAELMAPMLKNIAMHAAAMKPTTLSYKDFDAEYVAAQTAGRIEAIRKDNEELARLKKPLINVPEFVSRSQLTDEVLAEKEQQIKSELLASGKPEKIIPNILPGKLARYILDNTTLDQEQALLDQKYVMNDKLSVAEAVDAEAKKHGGTCEIVEFIRYEVGEGIEKKVDDFATEVAAQMS